MKKISLNLITIILCIAFGSYIIVKLNADPTIEVHEEITIVRERQVYFERMEINQRIQEIQAYEDYDKVIALYGNITGDREIARLILNNCLVRKIPVNLGFALCKQESNFVWTTATKNVKGGKILSTDYGLFQLNSATFRSKYAEYGKAWILAPENNVDLGLEYLRQLYDRHGDSWDRAIIRYNGRFEKGADEHLINIYKYEREFDKLFNAL